MHLGNAIMSFYSALIDLLGRCAPEMHVRYTEPQHPGWISITRVTNFCSVQLIQAGKGEALRIRAILRSLVPIEDLVGVISLPVQIPALGKGKTFFGILTVNHGCLLLLYLSVMTLVLPFSLWNTTRF